MRPAALKLAVIGDPVAHSASPALHRRFLAESGITGTYEALRIVAGDGRRAIAALRAAGYTGLNVTTPLKEEAYACADSRDAASLAAGAVNTLVIDELCVAGYNTDGLGAVGALRAAGLADLRGARVLVLGAGPTARATIVALVANGCVASIWNHTRAKADAIVTNFGARAWQPQERVDAVFATLPPGIASLDSHLRETVLGAPIVVDANYAARATLGALLGRDVRDGSQMLAASARASFELFRSNGASPVGGTGCLGTTTIGSRDGRGVSG